MSDTVNMVSPEGKAFAVPADQVAAARAQGFVPEDGGAAAARVQGEVRDEKFSGVGNQIAAGAAGALRSVTGGLSDAVAVGLGGEDARRELEALREVNRPASLIGEIGGAILPIGLPGKAASIGRGIAATAEGASAATKIGRAALGTGAEGFIMGAGQGVSELALSKDRLTPELVASTLSSNMLFGGAVGAGLGAAGKSLELGLGRAKSAIDDFRTRGETADALDADLATMDAKQLRAAREAELGAIESGRVTQRASAADEIAAHRSALDGEKIWLATAGSTDKELRAIGKVNLRATQQFDRLLDNPKALAKNPGRALDALQQEEHALEKLAAKAERMGPAPEVPRFADVADDVTTTVAARDLRAYGYQQLKGTGDDAVKMERARRAIREGQQEPIKVSISPKGTLDISDGRHRLAAALEMDAPITVQWSQGSKGLDSTAKKFRAGMESLGGDGRAAFGATQRDAAAKIPIALERNRALQARIAELQAAPASSRLTQIDDAKELLATSGRGSKTIGEEMLAGSAFSGAAGLTAMIPGIGPMLAPLVGARAARLIGDQVARRATKAASDVAKRGANAVSRLLTAGQRGAQVLPPIATRVLSSVRFGGGDEGKASKSRALPDLYKRTSEEVRSQTMVAPDGSIQMRPEARATMAAKLDPIRAVDPLAADQIESLAARRIEFIASKIPRRPDIGGMPLPSSDRWQPSDAEMRTFARYVAGVEDPMGIVERLAAGVVTPEDTEVMTKVYPQMHAAITQQIVEKLPALRTSLPYERRIALSIFTGQPVDASMEPRILRVLQRSFAAEQGTGGGIQPPTPQPQFGEMGSLAKPTRAQERSA